MADYFAYSMNDGKTYIGRINKKMEHVLEDVVVIDTVNHLTNGSKEVIDVVEFYKEIYRQVFNYLGKEKLGKLKSAAESYNLIIKWYLGRDIIKD